MAHLIEREKAITLRLKGYSYSQIKNELGISKSTLHYWLVDYPLSDERIRELRDNSAQRIERFRETCRRKKVLRLEAVRTKAAEAVGRISKKNILFAGFFLYWAEGMKVDRGTVLLTNTDPAMLKFFIKWLQLFGVPKEKLKVRLHLYSDMDIKKQTRFWANELGLPPSRFMNTYIKQSDSIKRRNYKGRFGQGTCAVWVHNRDLYEKIMMTIDVLKTEILK